MLWSYELCLLAKLGATEQGFERWKRYSNSHFPNYWYQQPWQHNSKRCRLSLQSRYTGWWCLTMR